MPMRRLTGLEREKLQVEYDQLQQRINELETLLNERNEFLKVLKKELRSLKRKYGDERRTKIIQPKQQKTPKKLPSNEKLSTPKIEKKSEEKVQALSLFTPQPPPKLKSCVS